MNLETAANQHRLRTTRLEDGEIIIPLTGWKSSARYPSNNAHCGVWGKGIWYALIPTKKPRYLAGAALAFDTSLNPQDTDAEVLVQGSPEAILALITSGPSAFRARKRRVLTPEQHAKLQSSNEKHRFTSSRGV